MRGKVVPLRDEKGKIVYETTVNGTKRVKAKHVSQGNSIRGAIHDQSFYGKIEKWKDNSRHEKESYFVIRRKVEFKSGNVGSGFKSWDDLEKQMVDKKLFKKFKAQYPETSFKDACAEGFFTYVVENGVRRKVKVRRVRCIAGTAQPLKKHIFQPQTSDKDQYYYVSPGEAYGIFEYVSNDGERLYESDNLFTLSEKMKNGRLKEAPCPKTIKDKKGKEYFHTRTILKDATILIYPLGESAESQYLLDTETISKRLYRINTIERERKRLSLTRHNIVKSYTGKNGIGDSDFNNLPDGMRMPIAKLNFLLLGTDFDIIDGRIIPKGND